MSYQRRRDRRHLGVAVAGEQRHADGVGDGIGDQPAGQRPLHRADDRSEREPYRDRAGKTEQCAVALRQHDVGQPEEDRRGVDRQACQRALGDEGGIMIEREEHVRRPRRNRQRRDQRPDHRTRSLGDDGSRHHERRRDRHAQASVSRKASSGDIFVVPANAGTHTPRLSRFCTNAVEQRSPHPWTPGGYGSLRSAGTTSRVSSHPLHRHRNLRAVLDGLVDHAASVYNPLKLLPYSRWSEILGAP